MTRPSFFESLESRTLLSGGGVRLIADLPPELSPTRIIQAGTSILFETGSGQNVAIWKTDGTAAGTVKLLTGYQSLTNAVEWSGELFIHTRWTLYRSDGTAAGTKYLAGAYPNFTAQVGWVGVVGDNLFYNEYRSDTPNGYTTFYARRPGGSPGNGGFSTGHAAPHKPLIDGDMLYAAGQFYAHPTIYWWYASDGVTATKIYDGPTFGWPGPGPQPAPAPDPGFASDSITVDGAHYFAFDDGIHGKELWIDDASGQRLFADLNPGADSSSPDGLSYVNGQLIFAATTATQGRDLYAVPIPPLSAEIVDGVLSIAGTTLADNIVVTSENGVTTVTLEFNGTSTVKTFDDADFTQIMVSGDEGDDVIDLSRTSKPATILGEAGNDTLAPGTGATRTDGGDGLDTLSFQIRTQDLTHSDLGDYTALETLICGSGDDTINIYAYNSSIREIFGEAGNDTLTIGGPYRELIADPSIHGGLGDDTLAVDREGTFQFPGGITYYFGDEGNDTLRMHRSFAKRQFFGGDGIDLVDYRNFTTAGGLKITLDDLTGDGPKGLDNVHSDVEMVRGSVWGDTLIGNDQAETLFGETGGDLLVGNGGDDSLVGGDSGDTLVGGAGADTLVGGIGIDTYDEELNDTVVELLAQMIFNALWIEGNNSQNVIKVGLKSGDPGTLRIINDGQILEFAISGISRIVIIGYGANDRISVSSSVTLPTGIVGGAGDDCLIGGGGDDSLNGDDGVDTLIGNGGADSLERGETLIQGIVAPGVARSSLSDGVLRIIGTAGNDSLIFRRSGFSSSIAHIVLNGVVFTYPYQQITGLRMEGAAGNDRLAIDHSLGEITIPATIYGGAGNDTIFGSAVADRIYGGDGADWISAGAGADVVYGEAGDDRIFGGEGRDYLVGGAGIDFIRGQAGIDRIFADKLLDDVRGNRDDLIINSI